MRQPPFGAGKAIPGTRELRLRPFKPSAPSTEKSDNARYQDECPQAEGDDAARSSAVAAVKTAELTSARTKVVIHVSGRRLLADIATKSLRKACVTLAENGPEATMLVLQGVLTGGDSIDEAGLAATVKAKPAEVAA